MGCRGEDFVPLTDCSVINLFSAVEAMRTVCATLKSMGTLVQLHRPRADPKFNLQERVLLSAG